MKQNLLPAIRMTIVCIVFFCGLYTVLILAAAQLAPERGNGETVLLNGKVVGYALEGQNFTNDKYFWSRPSAVAYNAAGSGGSNKGPTNPDYLKDVQSRIDTLLAHDRSLKKEDIPSELVTASGSGLDPDLSPVGAHVQVPRIARARGLSEEKVQALVDAHVQKALFGLFGTQRVNVLKLNLDLDAMHP